MVKLAMNFINYCYLIAVAHCGSSQENTGRPCHYPGNNHSPRLISFLLFIGRGYLVKLPCFYGEKTNSLLSQDRQAAPDLCGHTRSDGAFSSSELSDVLSGNSCCPSQGTGEGEYTFDHQIPR